MGLFVISLSDVGEGVAEAELVEWHVAVGDTVAEDQVLAVVMTDKAAVEVPSSVLGKVTHLCADIGESVAVGSELIHLEIDGEGNADAMPANAKAPPASSAQENKAEVESQKEAPVPQAANKADQMSASASVADNTKVLAAPTVRQKARELGVDLSTINGTGPGGRIVHDDLGRFTERRSQPGNSGGRPDTSVNVVKMVGMRRKIAEKMSLSKSRIPHITIVEEVDVHYLEELREELNSKHADERGKLTLLPFIMKSIVEAVREQPELNALFDDEADAVSQYGGVHIGVATQTPNGLMVPVVRHSEVNSLWENATELNRLADAAREGTAAREELSGSTITISSLGPLGAIATTPIINHPEVAIVGINKMTLRPHWDGQQFVPRKTMNISCSFDHRVVDGYDAAIFVQKLKTSLEKPAMLFVDG